MKHANPLKRAMSVLLALVLAMSLVTPAWAAESTVYSSNGVTWEKVDNDVLGTKLPLKEVDQKDEAQTYADTDVVRVSIVLKDASTIEKGFTADEIAAGSIKAQSYRDKLESKQEKLEKTISKKVLGGETLDVVWNLTLAANIISANVEYGQIEAIEQLKEVESVLIETRYEPCVTGTSETDPNMATSSEQIGSNIAWANGYTGAGSKIAVIDTGTDTDHQSFDASAFEYAIEQTGKDVKLMTVADIEDVLEDLNIAKLVKDVNDLYLNAKLPFAFNYVDEDLDITHDHDSQGEHGSHVAGIATANRYIPDGEGGYTDALVTAKTQGVAPDAQLITMKVFGKGGGAYDSDYMAAIEDAMVLGCDAANLSLGSGNPGFSRHSTAAYQAILDAITKSGMVVAMSAGNSGTWQENTIYGFLYSEGLSMQTDGSPGSYTNSLCVASVDNSGSTGNFLNFGGSLTAVGFSETTGYTNAPIATLDKSEDASGTEYDFVLFENTGKDGSGNNLLTDYADVTAGKVVLVYRGTSSFFEKHEAVAEVGGVACIVVNNQAGTINMDLSDSTASIPCVSVLQAVGETLKAEAAPVVDEDSNVLYYTGKVTVSGAIQAFQSGADFYTMSSFSSWGIPGSLEMKPEITAPGGNIYSVNGAVAGGKAYENMSGTSMASPQIAGMSAVVAQYIRDNGLAEKTGLSARQLAQSLLMSTAEPLFEEASGGQYYSILTQGAGLANVGAATTVGSYIMMDKDANAGAADGKVKVELGDDPGRTGTYSFGYTLYNLRDTASYFQLDADFFTQDIFATQTYTGVDTFLDTWTTLLSADVTWTVDGQVVDVPAPESLLKCDFNGDGKVTKDDGQALLDYVVGVRESISNEEYADLDADEGIDTYDAYLFFKQMSTSAVEVPAGGSVHVTVEAKVLGLEDYDDAGAYVEGFVYATEMTSDEGVLGDSHSIPVLGYYGSWSESSMYDVGTLAEYWYETETRYPYLGNMTGFMTNYLTIKYTGDSGEYYYFGNPLADDDEYLPERNAFNSGDTLSKYYVSIIRNAGAAMWQVTDATTGELYYRIDDLGSANSAYYYTNGSSWQNVTSSVSLNWQGTDQEGNKLPEGTEVNVSLVLAPEYYVSYDEEGKAVVDWDALGEGAYMTTRTAIDNTAPELEDVSLSLMSGMLNVQAKDNRYLACVALYQRGVEREIDYILPNQALDQMGETVVGSLDTSSLQDGAELYLQLTDYAMNQTTYKLVLNGDNTKKDPTSVTVTPAVVSLVKGTSTKLAVDYEPWIVNEGVVWSSADEAIATVDQSGKVTGVDVGTTTITATSTYDETVFGTCEVTVKSYDVTLTGILQDKDGNPLLFSWDMQNDKTWKKYADLANNLNAATLDFAHEDGKIFQMDTSGYLYKVDPATGETLEKSAAPAAFGAPVDDMEYAGLNNLMYQQDILVGVYGGYLLYSNGMENTFDSGWNMASYLAFYLGASNFTAVSWAGYDSRGRDVFFCLTDSCDIWVMMIDFNTGSAGLTWYETDLELDFPGYDGAYYCSMVMGDDGNIYLSYFDGAATNQIYVLEEEVILDAAGEYENSVFRATLLGDVGDSVWPCSLLSVSANEKTDEPAETVLTIEARETAEAQQIVLPRVEAVTGGLNAAPVVAETSETTLEGTPVAPTGSTIAVSEDETTVTVNVRAAELATNGLFTVEYDAAVMTLSDVAFATDYSSYKDEAGKVTLGYVDLDGVAADAIVATLTFTLDAAAVDAATVTITETERNDKAVSEVTELSAALHEETEVVDAKEPTCTEEGYTGDLVCKHCGKVVATGETIPATGHSYEDGVCTDCGAKEPSVKTGDTSNITLWVIVMVSVAALAAAVVVLPRRKRS